MTASPSQSLLTTHKLMLGRVLQNPVAPRGRKINHMTKSGTHHRHQADLLSDGTIQLDPNQSLPLNMSASPHTHPAPAGVTQQVGQHSTLPSGDTYTKHINICREIKNNHRLGSIQQWTQPVRAAFVPTWLHRCTLPYKRCIKRIILLYNTSDGDMRECIHPLAPT